MNFIHWDYNKNIATEYERKGECNQCGDCCKGGMVFKTADVIESNGRNGSRATTEKGIWNELVLVEDIVDNERIFFGQSRTYQMESACSSFREGIGCTKYIDRPQICKSWPHSPKDVARFRRCSYYFEKVDQWDFIPTPVALLTEGAMA